MDPQGGPGYLLGHTVSPWLLSSLFPVCSEWNMTAQGHMGIKGIVHQDTAIAGLYRGPLSYPPGDTSKCYSRPASPLNKGLLATPSRGVLPTPPGWSRPHNLQGIACSLKAVPPKRSLRCNEYSWSMSSRGKQSSVPLYHCILYHCTTLCIEEKTGA